MVKITQAMVLAAGEGRRLRPFTDHTPKPLISIAGKTMLDHALDQLTAMGVTHCVVNTYHLADQIETHLQTRTSPLITISREIELLGTGGSIAHALPYFKEQPFFVLNADIWWQDKHISGLRQLAQKWDCEKMDALLLLIPLEQAVGYEKTGDYFLETTGHIRHREKEAEAPYIFSGIRILHPRLLADQEAHYFSIVPLFHQTQRQGRLFGVAYDGLWGDVGTWNRLKSIQAAV